MSKTVDDMMDFASYIVDCGCMDVENIFELAYENQLYPYQYPVTKAYEMISCFEGLIEFYKVTDEKIPYNCVVKANAPLSNGKYIMVTDYASAGKLWTNQSKMAVWMLTK